MTPVPVPAVPESWGWSEWSDPVGELYFRSKAKDCTILYSRCEVFINCTADVKFSFCTADVKF